MRNYLFIMGFVLFATSCGSPDEKVESSTTAVCISDSLRKAASVYLASDKDNNPVISWCETDNAGKKFYYASFFDTAGQKFLPAISIPIEQNASIHEEGMPKIAVKGDGTLVAVYEISAPTKQDEWAGFVKYIQSNDKGRSWSQPRCVHSDTMEGESRSFAAITRLSNGEIGACWLDAAFDYRKGGRPVKFATTSGNNGFIHEILIDSVACECCRTAISSDENGNVVIMYRDIINDSIRDISVSRSVNNGQSFSETRSFSGDNWRINGCPHNGPGVVNTTNATFATWFTGGAQMGSWYAELDASGKTNVKKQITANGRNIQLCLLPGGGRVVAYNENIQQGDKIYSKIVLNKIDDKGIWSLDVTSSTTHAGYPVIRSFGDDKLVVAWAEMNKIYYRVLDVSDIKDVPRPLAKPIHQDNTGMDHSGMK